MTSMTHGNDDVGAVSLIVCSVAFAGLARKLVSETSAGSAELVTPHFVFLVRVPSSAAGDTCYMMRVAAQAPVSSPPKNHLCCALVVFVLLHSAFYLLSTCSLSCLETCQGSV